MLVIDFRVEWEVVGKFCDGSSRWAKSVMREFRDHFLFDYRTACVYIQTSDCACKTN